MYVTRPLSLYINQPSALSQPPPEGPNSGILVIQDEESEPTCCFGLLKSDEVLDLPFPQNKDLTLRYTTSSGTGSASHHHVEHFYASFVPVLDLPLSSNRYFVIQTHGRHKGEAHTNSKEEDMTSCCFCCNIVSDIPPQLFDQNNIYQQFEVMRLPGLFTQYGGFTARAVVPDGVPPRFLEKEGWKVHTSSRKNFQLGEAAGLNAALRSRLPDFGFPLSWKSSSPVVVGKWYCPFMFVREGKLKDQVKSSVFYEMTLEQKWEQVFECDNNYDINQGKSIVVDVKVQSQVVFVGGKEAQNVDMGDGVMWFSSLNNNYERNNGNNVVGLSMAIIERMKWEQERVGYIWGNERLVELKKVEELSGIERWKKYGCYVLVERFVVRRMDGSLVLTYEFKHTHRLRSKWE